MTIKAGQIVTLKTEMLEPGEANIPHVAIEDAFNGIVRVTPAGDVPNMTFKPINDWRIDWIAS